MIDMSVKPKVRIAAKEAFKDMKPEILELREYTNKEKRISAWWEEQYVPGISHLDTPESRSLNEELGLTTNEGINKWYKS